MIKLQNINKFFKNTQVLFDITLEIQKGECVVLSGVSGSGKSTLLSIIATLLKPSAGTLEIASLEVQNLSDYHLSELRKKTIGYVPQVFHLFENLTLQENLLGSIALEKNIDADSLINKAMENGNIFHKAKTEVSKLSGGEKQRAVIARALLHNPKILLFDEPTANLDHHNTLHLQNILEKLKAKGKTIIIATHDPFISNLKVVDRIISIKDGSLE